MNLELANELEWNKICSDPWKGFDGIDVDVLRLDKIHSIVSGNKWFKLKYEIAYAKANGYDRVMSFGGAFSNHILALAYTAKSEGLQSVGLIRGEIDPQSSPTLKDALHYGMELISIGRKEFREKTREDFLEKLKSDLPGTLMIPEGGYGIRGAKGAAEILRLQSVNAVEYSHILCAVGTGTLMAGIINAAAPGTVVLGIPVMKGNMNLINEVKVLLSDRDHPAEFSLLNDFHFGGYAKYSPGLIRFMNEFYHHTQIPTDFVYTAKLMYATQQLCKDGRIEKGSRVLVIHSGGIQGNRSLQPGTLDF